MIIDSDILQVLVVILILVIIFLAIKICISVKRSKRIEDFAIKQNNGRLNVEYRFFKFVHKFSYILKNLVIFNTVAHSYDKYLTKDNKNFRMGLDYISLKFIISFFFVILYLLGACLYLKKIDSFFIFLSFVVGFFIVDIILVFKYDKKRTVIVNDILKAVIIMNNSFKANKSMEQALDDVVLRLDGPIKDEFLKIINDIKLGLSLQEAFFRMYKRTELEIVSDIANMLSLVAVLKTDFVTIFDMIEKRIVEEEKLKNRIKNIKIFNGIFMAFMVVLPILLIVLVVCLNSNYYNMIVDEKGYIVIGSLVILYTIYLLLVRRMVRGAGNGR